MQKTIVIGAAGTGKTYLLVESISRLLSEEMPEPEGCRILIIASSLRALKDLRTRLKNVCPDTRADHVAIHTVRSLCHEVLRESHPELQLISDFRARHILREQISTMTMRSNYERIKSKGSFVREMLELIEAASVNSISIEQLPGRDQAADKLEDIKNIYKYYRDFCHQHNLVPAFDTIPRALDLLSKYGEQFSHIFIDQYEDLYPGEVQAIRSLVRDHADVTVFIDDERFGSDSASALWPGEDIKELGIPEYAVGLSANVRSRLTPGMAEHVNRFLEKVAYPSASAGSDTVLTVAVEETAIDEAEYMARVIRKEMDASGRKCSDFAILCRDPDAIGGIISDALRKFSIPCSGGVNVSRNHLVRFTLLCLQVAAGQDEDDLVLKWLSSPVARLNRADLHRSYINAKNRRRNFLSAIIEDISRAEAQDSVPFFHKSSDRLKEILSIIGFARSELRSGSSIWELVEPILAMSGAIDAGRMPALPGEPHAVEFFIQMIRDVEAAYQEKPGLLAVLDDIEDGLAQMSEMDEPTDGNGDRVRIMPIWESRGSEFPFVFIPGMVSDLFPARHPARQLLYGEDLGPTRSALRGIDLPGTISPDKWLDQERQLFYIAMTRAKEKLYLTSAHHYPENEDCEPSPFLADLLDGKEISTDNCAQCGILYQERAVSSLSDKLPSPEEIASRTDLEIACCRYVRELERMDQRKAEEITELLASAGVFHEPQKSMRDIPIALQPGAFSYTSIRNFLSCPRRYFLAHLLRVEPDYGPGAQFGRLVHKALGLFHDRYRDLSSCDLEELQNVMRRTLFHLWNGGTDMEEEEFPGYGAEFAGNRLQAQSYLRIAEETLLTYLQTEYSRWHEGRSCILTEDGFQFAIFGKYNLIGRIDRIDACALGEEIVDFKTSLYDKDGESALISKFLNVDDDPDYRPEDYQLPIYYFACLDDPNRDPKKLVMYQLRNFSKSTGGPFRREIEVLPDVDTRSEKKDKFITRADLESVKDDMLKTLDGMVSGVYNPEPRKYDVCERECEFSFICDREESENS
jgi:DNA helicase-2/ATP-dependent DNA helicase PcrA